MPQVNRRAKDVLQQLREMASVHGNNPSMELYLAGARVLAWRLLLDEFVKLSEIDGLLDEAIAEGKANPFKPDPALLAEPPHPHQEPEPPRIPFEGSARDRAIAAVVGTGALMPA